MYSARTSVTRSRSRRRGDGFLCYCRKPQWFQVNPLLAMRTDRRSGIRRSDRDSSDQGNSMELPVREYTGSPDKPLHSGCAYREGDRPGCRIAPTVNSAGGRRVNSGRYGHVPTFRKLLTHDFRNIYKQHAVGYFHNLAHLIAQRNDIRWIVVKLIPQRKYTR